MSLFKSIFFRTFSILFGLLLGLLIGEIICRLAYFGADAFNIKKINSFVTIGYTGFIQPAEDQYVWYEMKPDLDDLFKMHPIQTNSKGLRDKEYSITKPDNTFRVAVIGDSFTFGDGVKEAETYHAVLETHLNERSDSLQYEFINFGLAGYDLLNYLGNIKAKALEYDPDLILIGFCGNNDDDLADPRQWNEPFPGYKYEKYSWFIRQFLIVRTVGNLISSRRRMNNEKISKQKEEKAVFMNQMFAEFGKVKIQEQIPFLVFYLSMADAAPEKAKKVAQLCNENGLDFLDSSPFADKVSDISKYWVHQTDHHPNAAMHEIYAALLKHYFVKEKSVCGN